MSHTRGRLFALGRPLDPSWPSNRAVMVLVPVTGLAVSLGAWSVVGLDPLVAAGMGLRWAAAIFGAWALARELAPDDQAAAFVAMAAAVLVLGAVPQTGLWLVFVGLATARLVNRTVGAEARPADSFAVLLLAGAAAWQTGLWSPMVAAALAFGLDARLVPAGPRRHRSLAVVSFVLGAAWAFAGPSVAAGSGTPTSVARATAWVCLFVFGAQIVRTRRLVSVDDTGSEALSPPRVRAGMLTAAVLASGTLIGSRAVFDQALLTTAVLGAVGLAGLMRTGERR